MPRQKAPTGNEIKLGWIINNSLDNVRTSTKDWDVHLARAANAIAILKYLQEQR